MITGQLFHRMSVNLGLSDASSRIDSSHTSLAGISQKQSCALEPIRLHTVLICSIIDDVNFDHLVEVLYWFPKVTVTNYHKCSDLKQRIFFLSYRSEDQKSNISLMGLKSRYWQN